MILSIPLTIHTTSGHVFEDVVIKKFAEDFLLVEDEKGEEIVIFYNGIKYVEV